MSRRPAAPAGVAIARALGDKPPFIAHPWPVTPYHDDYVHEYDLLQRARERAAGTVPSVRATGPLARALTAGGVSVTDGADAVVEEITLSSLLDGVETRLAGWHGPPWLKEGWFHAWLLQSSIMPAATRREAEDTFRRRTEGGGAGTAAERIDLERRLVTQAAAGCERVVLGYTVRREALDDDYSAGIENIAVDSQAGIGSPMFLRTVKLKDFRGTAGWPWASTAARARRGIRSPASRTRSGRLVWAAVGDPALLLDPDNGRFIPNRARLQRIEDAGEVPDRRARARGGALKPAGAGVTARTKLVYRVPAVEHARRQRMSAADLLYPYALGDAVERERRSRVRPRDRPRDSRHARGSWPRSGSSGWTRRSGTSPSCRSSMTSRWPRSI